MDNEMLMNEQAAHGTMVGISNPITRSIVHFAIAEVRSRVVQQAKAEQDRRGSAHPDAFLDMKCFVDSMTSLFGKTDVLIAVLDGKPVDGTFEECARGTALG